MNLIEVLVWLVVLLPIIVSYFYTGKRCSSHIKSDFLNWCLIELTKLIFAALSICDCAPKPFTFAPIKNSD